MPIRMTHPDHGTTFAVGPEVEQNEKHGWKVEEKAPKQKPAEAQDVTPVDATDLKARYTEKFGKPPHHRKKQETIEAELRE